MRLVSYVQRLQAALNLLNTTSHGSAHMDIPCGRHSWPQLGHPAKVYAVGHAYWSTSIAWQCTGGYRGLQWCNAKGCTGGAAPCASAVVFGDGACMLQTCGGAGPHSLAQASGAQARRVQALWILPRSLVHKLDGCRHFRHCPGLWSAS